MIELDILILEIYVILAIFILIFIYSVIATDTVITFLSFIIFLVFLIPFYTLLEKLELLLFVNNFENYVFFRLVFFYSFLITFFIGIFLFIELIYLTFLC